MHSRFRPLMVNVVLAALVLLGGGCSPAAKRAKLLQNADASYQKGELDKAEIEYLSVLKDDRLNPHAIAQLGLLYTAQGRNSRGVAYIMKGHQLLPDDLDLRTKVGQFYLATGKMAEARAEANFILDHRPADAEAPLLLVSTLTKPEEAASLRQRLLALPAPAPQGAPVLTALAVLELRQGHPPAAEALLQKAKAADAGFASQYSIRGAILLTQKNIVAADQAFLQAATLSPPRSPRQLQYAQFKIRSGDVAGGTRYLEEITKKTPDYIPALMALSELKMTQKQLPECGALLEKILSRDPENVEAMILQGRLFNMRHDTDKALTLFEKLATNYPRVAVIQQELGRAYANKGDFTKAISSLSQAVTLAPGSSEAVLMLAQLNSRRGDTNAAVVLLRKLAAERPDLPQARLMLADLYRNQNNLDEAQALYQGLEKELPGNPEIPLLRGLTLAKQGKSPEARQEFERAFGLNPESPAALEQLVNLDLRDKNFDAAAARVKAEAAKNKHLEGFAQLLLAKIALVQNDLPAAEACLKKAIEFMPESPNPYLLLAGIYTRTNQQEKALGQLAEVIKRDPQQFSAQLLVGSIEEQRGNYAAARDAYEKVLLVNPRSVVALNNLAYVYTDRFKDLDKAQDLAQQARQLAPNDPHTADTLGWIVYRKGQYAWALTLLQEAAEKLPAEAEVQYHLGLVHYMMGEETSARDQLNRALELEATAKWAPEARQYLALLAIDPAAVGAAARATLEQAVAAHPDDPVALARLAALQERDGKTDLAIATVETALKANNHNVSLMLSLARLYGSAKNSAKALEYAKAARKQAPDDADIAWSLGRLAIQNGDFAWGVSLLQEAARKLPESPDLLYDLAQANYSVGRVADAQTALRNALALAARQTLVPFPRLAAARQWQTLLPLADDPAEAARQSALIEQTLRSTPDSVPALMAKGAAGEQRLETDTARQAYAKVLTVYPDFTPAKRRLAILGGSLRTFDQAVYDWALQARTAYPNDAQIAKTLGIQSYLKGDHTRALSLLKESLAANDQDAELFYFQGLAQYRLKDAAYPKSLQRALDLGLKDKAAETEARKLLAEGKK